MLRFYFYHHLFEYPTLVVFIDAWIGLEEIGGQFILLSQVFPLCVMNLLQILMQLFDIIWIIIA